MLGPDGSQPRGFTPSTSPLYPFDVAALGVPGSSLGFVPLQGPLQIDTAPTLPTEVCSAAGPAAPSTAHRSVLLPSLWPPSFHRPPKCAASTVPPVRPFVRRLQCARAPFGWPLLNFRLLWPLHRSSAASTGWSFRDHTATYWLFFCSRLGFAACRAETLQPTAPRNPTYHRSGLPPPQCRSLVPLPSVLPKQPSDHPAHGPPFLPHRNATERRRSLLTEANRASRPHRSAAGSAAIHLLTEAKL